jgi:hypothetical protein
MSFKEHYTTSELISKESLIDLKDLPKDFKLEKDKTLISNDAMAIGQLLELLINRGLR